jgi:hypothetical protein
MLRRARQLEKCLHLHQPLLSPQCPLPSAPTHPSAPSAYLPCPSPFYYFENSTLGSHRGQCLNQEGTRRNVSGPTLCWHQLACPDQDHFSSSRARLSQPRARLSQPRARLSQSRICLRQNGQVDSIRPRACPATRRIHIILGNS